MTIKFSCRVRMKFGASKMESKNFRNQDQNSLWMLTIKRISNILWPSSGRPNRIEWQWTCVRARVTYMEWIRIQYRLFTIQIQTNYTKWNEGQTMVGNQQQGLCDNIVTVSHVNVSKNRINPNAVHETIKCHLFRLLLILSASASIVCVIIY